MSRRPDRGRGKHEGAPYERSRARPGLLLRGSSSSSPVIIGTGAASDAHESRPPIPARSLGATGRLPRLTAFSRCEYCQIQPTLFPRTWLMSFISHVNFRTAIAVQVAVLVALCP